MLTSFHLLLNVFSCFSECFLLLIEVLIWSNPVASSRLRMCGNPNFVQLTHARSFCYQFQSPFYFFCSFSHAPKAMHISICITSWIFFYPAWSQILESFFAPFRSVSGCLLASGGYRVLHLLECDLGGHGHFRTSRLSVSARS